MTGSARAFVAVVPPADVLDAVERVLAPIRAAAPPHVAWSRRAQWHLTLQFLGAVDDVDVLEVALVDRLRSAHPVTVGLGGAGAFPSDTRAAVIWLGLDQGTDGLASLTEAVHDATALVGHRAEARPFTPHLTVARSRRPRPVGSLIAAVGDGPIGRAWDAHEVQVIESTTAPTGAVYREIAHVALGSPNSAHS